MSQGDAVVGRSISVVAPCYNEAACIDAFYAQLKPVLASLRGYRHEIVFVDDGSTDGTVDRLRAIRQRDPAVRLLLLSRNFGHQIALTAGLDAAGGDAVIMMDSDLQHPPELIPRMVQCWEAGAEVVSMVRTRGRNLGPVKRLASWLFYRVIRLLTETPIVPGVADFCLLSGDALAAVRRMPERHRFLRGMIAWTGFDRRLIEFESPPRAGGKPKYTLRKSLALALTAAFSYSAFPLRLATRLGLTVTAVGTLYLVYVLVSAIFFPQAIEKGWPSLISVVLILGGLQLTFIGLIGEYLARVYEETKRRPLYLLKHDDKDEPAGGSDETGRSAQ